MSTLQAQSDSDFQDFDSQGLDGQRAAEDARVDDAGYPQITYADEGADDYPAPEPLEYDGQGHKRPVDELDFSDAGGKPPASARPAEPVLDQDPAESRQVARESTDIHASDEPSRDEFDRALLARAKVYGLDEQIVRKQYQSPDMLEKALLAIDQQGISQFQAWQQAQAYYAQQQQQWQQQQQQQRPPMQAPQQQQLPPPTPQPQQPPMTEQQQLEAFEAYKLQNPELYDESLAGDLSGLAAHTAQQIQQQRQQMEYLQQVVAQQQTALQQFYQRQQQDAQYREQLEFDERIQNLGNGWDEVLGAEHALELDASSPEIANRRKVYETAQKLQQFHSAQGRFMSLRDVLPSALLINFPDRQAAAAASGSRTASDRARDSQGRFLARPTRRQRPESADRREQAMRRADEWYSKHGMPGDFGGGRGDI